MRKETIPGQIYPKSRHLSPDGKLVYMIRENGTDCLVAEKALGFSGEDFENAEGKICTLAPCSHENAELLRKYFPFTAPKPVLSSRRTVGVGDRLGIAAPGHLRVFARYDALPILAQQSIRELTLTGRTFQEVLDCASFAVFREDFQRGFGADGDHLKTPEEVSYALSCGYTMITLDCSEHIRNDVSQMSHERKMAEYQKDADLEERYLGKSLKVSDTLSLYCGPEDFYAMVLIYGEAIAFIDRIYRQFIENSSVDFEISIDETMTPTTPLQHFFVANELHRRGIKFATIAPRFCGEFQKGVDYIGDLEQLKMEMEQHAAIAEHFGYKLSLHSGSDKFSVFPIFGKATGGHFHVKTAGTNWLEAMKLVAEKAPELYREVHAFALEAFAEASKYYHVTTDIGKIPPLDTLTDSQLPELFSQNDARQLIHITYGLILTAKNPDGSSRFRDRLYQVWDQYREEYAQALDCHIGKHLQLLYQQIPTE